MFLLGSPQACESSSSVPSFRDRRSPPPETSEFLVGPERGCLLNPTCFVGPQTHG